MLPVAAALPEWLEPMAATLTQERFTGPEWIFERKLDGIRLLAFKRGRTVQLFSRNRLPQNGSYPSVVEAVANLPVRDAILDGEAIGVWAGGEQGRVAYHVFDIPWLDGKDLTQLPLDERRAMLKKVPFKSPLHHVPELKDEKPWERACAEGWEGVIAKRRDSQYEHRRSPHWLKMKCEASQELVIGAFTDPQGSRVGLGSLLVGYFTPDRREFVYAGKVGTGFDTKLLLELRARLDKLETPAPPFTKTKGLPKIRTHWVKPEIVVQVAFMEWTGHGRMRHPRLLGLRTDKAARDVVREQA
jgi:bifunctional non-homologous end joining protein LigD